MHQEISEYLFRPHGFKGAGWAMTFAEKFALCGILERRRPAVAVEIGTLEGGSLGVLAHYAEKVISIDPNPQVRENLQGLHPNVQFITARSQDVLPDLVEEWNQSPEPLGFALVDGDHTETGVRRDIECLLKYQPKEDFWLLMHDSFNPDCRRGMKAIDWSAHEHVHWVNFDFIPGFLSNIPGWEGQMWCGFALAYLKNEKRTGKLPYGELLAHQFETLYPLSAHAKEAGSAG